jgi:hypothetical protein
MLEESACFGLLLTVREMLHRAHRCAARFLRWRHLLDVTLLFGKPDRKHPTLLLAATSGWSFNQRQPRRSGVGAGSRRDLALGRMLQTGKPICSIVRNVDIAAARSTHAWDQLAQVGTLRSHHHRYTATITTTVMIMPGITTGGMKYSQ